jgi:hypothetical protein
MGALARRRMMVILPIAGILTILSGIWLYWHASVGFDPAYMRSRPGMVYGLGMAATLVAFLIGILVVRPTMTRLATADPSEARKLRARAGAMSTLVALLVGVSVICMAVGRYV